MANLQTRLERLEGKRGSDDAGPSVIMICDATTGEPRGALVVGGAGLTREADESADAFTGRMQALSNDIWVYN